MSLVETASSSKRYSNVMPIPYDDSPQAPFLLANADFYGTLAATRALGAENIPVYVAADRLLGDERNDQGLLGGFDRRVGRELLLHVTVAPARHRSGRAGGTQRTSPGPGSLESTIRPKRPGSGSRARL